MHTHMRMRGGSCCESRLLRGCGMMLFITMCAVVFLLALLPRAVELDSPVPIERIIKDSKNAVAVDVAGDDDNIQSAAKSKDNSMATNMPLKNKKSPDKKAPSKGSSASLLKQLDDLMRGGNSDREKALELCRQNYNKRKKDPEFMWRFVKALYIKSKIEGAKDHADQQKKLCYEAKSHGEESLKLTSNSGDVFKWYTLALGNTVEYESLKDQVKLGVLFKDNLEKAIKLKPEDPTLYYMLGRWCYKVYMLSWIERRVASTMLGKPLSATINDALSNFVKSDRLRTKEGLTNDDGKLKDNYLYVAKCYVEMKKYDSAVVFLKKANRLPNRSRDDEVSQKEVKQLLSRYS